MGYGNTNSQRQINGAAQIAPAASGPAAQLQNMLVAQQRIYQGQPNPTTGQPSWLMNYADINGMPQQDYQQLKAYIVGAVDHTRYAYNVITAGTTVPVGPASYFNHVVGDTNVKSIDGGTTLASYDNRFTNMLDVSKIETGWTLIVESLQVECSQTHRDFNAFASNLDEPNDATALAEADLKPASNQVRALQRVIYLLFSSKDNVITEKFAEGRIDKFPFESSTFGFSGGSTNEGIVQNANSLGRPKYLRSPVVLQSQHLFRVDLNFINSLICPQNVEIGVNLVGLLVPTAG